MSEVKQFHLYHTKTPQSGNEHKISHNYDFNFRGTVFIFMEINSGKTNAITE